MVQRLFNELYQRAIKGLLVQLTRSALALINVSLPIVRLTISLQAPAAPIPLPLSNRCCIETTITCASVLIKCEWWMSSRCHLPTRAPSLVYAQTNSPVPPYVSHRPIQDENMRPLECHHAVAVAIADNNKSAQLWWKLRKMKRWLLDTVRPFFSIQDAAEKSEKLDWFPQGWLRGVSYSVYSAELFSIIFMWKQLQW